MAEISINEYVRTIDGYIRKIDNINIDKKQITYRGKYILDIPYKNSQSIAKDKILEHSKNIKKLIKEGDYVNGHLVLKVEEDGFLLVDDKGYTHLAPINIKSIMTKEQFEAVKYEIK